MEERFGLSWLFLTRGQVESAGRRRGREPRSAFGGGAGLAREAARLAAWDIRPSDRASGRAQCLGRGLDLVLDRPRDPADDAALAAAIAGAKRVVLFEFLDGNNRPIESGALGPVLNREQPRGPCRRSSRAQWVGVVPLPKMPTQFWAFQGDLDEAIRAFRS